MTEAQREYVKRVNARLDGCLREVYAKLLRDEAEALEKFQADRRVADLRASVKHP